MRKILNFGSLNIDYVYSVDNFVRAGETIGSNDLKIFSGGKGLNQSAALAKAGAEVYHAGKIGIDGDILLDELRSRQVDVRFIRPSSFKTGHAIIQVNTSGQNCILLYPGANHDIRQTEIDDTFNFFSGGDILLLQNEINHIPYIIKKAHEKGMEIIINPSPISRSLLKYPLDLVGLFILNEVEAEDITGQTEPEAQLKRFDEILPSADVLLTMGEKGSLFKSRDETFAQDIFKADAVDTTAAGDTFLGYFIGARVKGYSIPACLRLASAAAAISVTRHGASLSIPDWQEVEAKASF